MIILGPEAAKALSNPGGAVRLEGVFGWGVNPSILQI